MLVVTFIAAKLVLICSGLILNRIRPSFRYLVKYLPNRRNLKMEVVGKNALRFLLCK
jgi:hypothetical protein